MGLFDLPKAAPGGLLGSSPQGGVLNSTSRPLQPNLLDGLYAQYPGLSRLGIQLKDSSATGTDWRGEPYAGRKLEFYPASESYNPNPGKPTIEVFSKDVGTKDAFGEVFSHLLPKVDQEFGRARTTFIKGLDEKQKNMLRGDYEAQVRSGLYPQQKLPTFDEWLNTTGGDAFFRGYVAEQYPKEFYRPDQIKLFDSLVNKLKR